MLGLNLVRSALSTLASNITGLAATVADINRDLRQRAALDDAGEAPPLEIDMAGKASGLPQDATATADAPTARNGRRRGATV